MGWIYSISCQDAEVGFATPLNFTQKHYSGQSGIEADAVLKKLAELGVIAVRKFDKEDRYALPSEWCDNGSNVFYSTNHGARQELTNVLQKI